MNLRSLEYLVAIDDLKHFGKAAERCHVSQPTLSGQLKKLEEHLDVRLVERDNRTVFLTEAGGELAERARKVLAEVAAMEELARSYANPMSGRIRMGLIPTIAPYLLPLIIGPIKEQWTELRLVLHEAQTAVLVEQLRNGDLDVLILALGVPGTDGFEALRLYDEPFQLAVPKSHELARKDYVMADELNGLSLLLLEDGHCLRGQALDWCTRAGMGEVDNFRGTSLETLRHMVASGDGMTLIPRLSIGSDSADRVVYLPFKGDAPHRDIGMLYRSNSGRRMCFRNIAGVIRETIGALL